MKKRLVQDAIKDYTKLTQIAPKSKAYKDELASILENVKKAEEAEQRRVAEAAAAAAAVAAAAAAAKQAAEREKADRAAREAAAARSAKRSAAEAADAAAAAKDEKLSAAALDPLNFYTVLGVTPDVSDDDLKAAYKKNCLQWHPDRHHTVEGKAEADTRFKVCCYFFYLLMSPEKFPKYLSKLYHSSATNSTQAIGQAYNTLKDSSKREKYDRRKTGDDDEDFSMPSDYNFSDYMMARMAQMFGMPPGVSFSFGGGGGPGGGGHSHFYDPSDGGWYDEDEEYPPRKGARARRGQGRR